MFVFWLFSIGGSQWFLSVPAGLFCPAETAGCKLPVRTSVSGCFRMFCCHQNPDEVWFNCRRWKQAGVAAAGSGRVAWITSSVRSSVTTWETSVEPQTNSVGQTKQCFHWFGRSQRGEKDKFENIFSGKTKWNATSSIQKKCLFLFYLSVFQGSQKSIPERFCCETTMSGQTRVFVKNEL